MKTRMQRTGMQRVGVYKSASVAADKGWKSKYKDALAEANRRLVAAGIEPVHVYKDHKKKSKYKQLELDL